jgi:8-amino-7-oxononanoate synthase
VLDFTSALYLGMRHASRSLEPWEQLTTGAPAALQAPAGAAAVEQALAELQGCERSTLAPSTLHLFWDLFGMLARRPAAAIYLDAGAYPIARWGVERAAARGAPVRIFRHHDAGALRKLLKQHAGARPVVVTDGYCPGCGEPAPLGDYVESARAYGGHLIMDDTQALGIFGSAPGDRAPYGTGGGGMLRWHGLAADPHVVVVSSLAKGFGVPAAALSGCASAIRCFEERSDTRVHCSPPSAAVVHASRHALAVNRVRGDSLRLRLARLVGYFRRRLSEVGLSAAGGLFPVQTINARPALDFVTLHSRLLRMGVRTVLHRLRAAQGARLSFIITALHSPELIDRAVSALACAVLGLKAGAVASEVCL